jgi:hypothetical protein
MILPTCSLTRLPSYSPYIAELEAKIIEDLSLTAFLIMLYAPITLDLNLRSSFFTDSGTLAFATKWNIYNHFSLKYSIDEGCICDISYI